MTAVAPSANGRRSDLQPDNGSSILPGATSSMHRGRFDVLLLQADQFDALLAEVIEALPARWRAIAAEIPITVDDEPDLEAILAVRGWAEPEAITIQPWRWDSTRPLLRVACAMPLVGAHATMWPLDYDLAGLCVGHPRGMLGPDASGPTEIRIYRGCAQRRSRTVDELRRHLRNVVEHELGHYLGLTEAEIAAAHHRP